MSCRRSRTRPSARGRARRTTPRIGWSRSSNVRGLDGFATGQLTIDLPAPLTNTTPDVAWPDQQVALYLDGLSKEIHGSIARARSDELLRDAVEELGWKVIVIAASHLDDPELLRAGLRRIARALKRADAVQRISAASIGELIAPVVADQDLPDDGIAVLTRRDAAPYVQHVPLYNVRAAAGRFLEHLDAEEEGWVLASGPVDERCFAIHVEGSSMAPGIPDRAIAIFRAGAAGGGPGGSRNGKVVLAALEDGVSTSYIVKRYVSHKRPDGNGGWEHARITLASDNPEHDDVEIEPGDDVRVVAEFVTVLSAADGAVAARGAPHE